MEAAPTLVVLLAVVLVAVVLHAFARALWDEHFWSTRRRALRALAVVGSPERVLSRQCWLGRHRHCRPDRWLCECRCHGYLP